IIRVTIDDTNGLTATCMTEVDARGRGLRVELTWDGLGDVDLHLHNATISPWFGRQNGMAAANTDDCFYANCSQAAVPAGPIWDPLSMPYFGANPALDVDNIISYGPENIRVNSVKIGDSFTVGIDYFWDHGNGTRTASVTIFCGEVLT